MNRTSKALVFALGLGVLFLASCSPAAQTGSGDEQATLTVRMQAEYTGAGLSAQAAPNGPWTACRDDVPEDVPPYVAGLDCDGDGGVIQYITPSTFIVAFKRATLYHEDGTSLELVPLAAALADSTVVDLTEPAVLTVDEVPLGRYTRLSAEIYFYELVMPINDPSADEHIRVYLSDDDFPTEGSRGHHQGDITMIGADGTELGFVGGGQPWTVASLAVQRGEATNGAGGTDPETGHDRGLCGDAAFWNAAERNQGPNQDLFVFEGELELDLTAAGSTVTIVFDVADTWMYEDFDGNELFNPCSPPGPSGISEACDENAGWAPLFPFPPEIVVE